MPMPWLPVSRSGATDDVILTCPPFSKRLMAAMARVSSTLSGFVEPDESAGGSKNDLLNPGPFLS